MTVCSESDGDLRWIFIGQMGNKVCNTVFVSQHKSVVNVSTKNKQASGVMFSKKCQFTEQQNQISNLPTMVAAHGYAFCLSVNVLSRNKKVAVVDETV